LKEEWHRRTVVATEIGNRLEIGHKMSEQPNQLDISPRFALKTPTKGMRFR
jgi:hypothetical protein